MLSIIQIRRADLEQGSHGRDITGEASINLSEARDRVCRICHMGLESDRHVYGVPIELGCSCKHDLAAAHKLCAETWFRSQVNRTCEICHSVARNVFATNKETTENLRDNNNIIIVSRTLPETPRSFCPDRRFLIFCIFFIFFIALVITWVLAWVLGWTCEICHSAARNVFAAIEETTENLSDSNNAITLSTLPTLASPETRRFWQGRRFLNFMLICMVIAFVISWAFHFHFHSP